MVVMVEPIELRPRAESRLEKIEKLTEAVIELGEDRVQKRDAWLGIDVSMSGTSISYRFSLDDYSGDEKGAILLMCSLANAFFKTAIRYEEPYLQYLFPEGVDHMSYAMVTTEYMKNFFNNLRFYYDSMNNDLIITTVFAFNKNRKYHDSEITQASLIHHSTNLFLHPGFITNAWASALAYLSEGENDFIRHENYRDRIEAADDAVRALAKMRWESVFEKICQDVNDTLGGMIAVGIEAVNTGSNFTGLRSTAIAYGSVITAIDPLNKPRCVYAISKTSAASVSKHFFDDLIEKVEQYSKKELTKKLNIKSSSKMNAARFFYLCVDDEPTTDDMSDSFSLSHYLKMLDEILYKNKKNLTTYGFLKDGGFSLERLRGLSEDKREDVINDVYEYLMDTCKERYFNHLTLADYLENNIKKNVVYEDEG